MTISIQPANMPDGSYNVRLPLRYPYHVDPETGDCLGWAEGTHLVGFQTSATVQHVDLYREDWANDPLAAVGMFPVLSDGRDSLYNLTTPISNVDLPREFLEAWAVDSNYVVHADEWFDQDQWEAGERNPVDLLDQYAAAMEAARS